MNHDVIILCPEKYIFDILSVKDLWLPFHLNHCDWRWAGAYPFGHVIDIGHRIVWFTDYLGPRLLKWININLSMDKDLWPIWSSVGWNYFSIPKLQRLHRRSMGMDK